MQIPFFKTCTKCGQTKFITSFTLVTKNRDGHETQCKKCVRIRQQAWADQFKKGRPKMPPEERKEHNRQAAQRWRERHPAESRDVQKRWKENNPERYKELETYHTRQRRARILGSDGTIATEDWRALCEHYGFHCLRCGKQFPFEKLTLDHVQPLAKGGAHTIDNAQPLCFNCNCKKHAKHIDYRPKWD